MARAGDLSPLEKLETFELAALGLRFNRNQHRKKEGFDKEVARRLIFDVFGNFEEDLHWTYIIASGGYHSTLENYAKLYEQAFFKHTGRRINEYINHLRIMHTVGQLEDSGNGKKIIDIALATGFESLSTFNRVFKNNIGTTPSEYRKNKLKKQNIKN